jgi:hypothetical protein
MNNKERSAAIEANLMLGVDLPKHIDERLSACLMESDKPDRIAGAIMYEFKVHELEQVISKLVALYDIAPGLLHKFWQRSSDACPLEVSEAEQQENEWRKWIYKATRC